MDGIWPNFFIVGGSRCGTTSLYNYLKAVPSIFMPEWKAPNYFTPKRTIDKETYLELFKSTKGKNAIGESSGYLTVPESPRLIHETIPDAKIIISLRDPVERVFSHYLQGLGGNYYSGTFEDAFSIYQANKTDTELFGIMEHMVKGSYYSKPVKRFLDTFGEKQVKIIIFEEYTADTKKLVKEILKFLEVNEDVSTNIEKIYNPYRQPLGKFGKAVVRNQTIKGVVKSILPGDSAKNLLQIITSKKEKKPVLGNYERIELAKKYVDDVESLKNILGRELPWKFSEYI